MPEKSGPAALAMAWLLVALTTVNAGVDQRHPSHADHLADKQSMKSLLGNVGEKGVVEVGKMPVTVLLYGDYAYPPVIFATVATSSGSEAVFARVYNKLGPCTPLMEKSSSCSHSGRWEFELALQSSKRATCCGGEQCCGMTFCCDDNICAVPHKVSWLALSAGSLKNGAWQVGAAKADENNMWYYMPFTPRFRSVPVVITALQTAVSHSLTTTRQFGTNREGFQYMVHSQEPTIEVIGWLAVTRGVGTFVDGFGFAAGTIAGGINSADGHLAKVNFGYRFADFPSVFSATNVWEALVDDSYATGVLAAVAPDQAEMHLAVEPSCRESKNKGNRYGTVNYIAIAAVSASQCLNGGTCLSSSGKICTGQETTGIKCHCPRGYSGPRCATDSDECSSNPCAHGSTCLESAIAGDIPLGQYGCNCHSWWSGENCEIDVNECRMSTSCRHGGICKNKPGGYACSCRPGFTGATCELDVDWCESNPCFNAATCVDGTDTYRCNCLPTFSGDRCQIDMSKDADECISSPCVNGGSCLESNVDVTVPTGKFYCVCTLGHSGTRCEVDTEECASDPCVNGGICASGVGFYRCSCSNGFSGNKCEIDIDECMSFPCLHSATCQHGPNSFKCICREGYTGFDCADGANIWHQIRARHTDLLHLVKEFPLAREIRSKMTGSGTAQRRC